MTKKAKVPYTIKSISDEQGNLLILKKNDKRTILSLKLKAHTKVRRIGTINLQRKIFEVRRRRAKHLLRVNQSYGFNYKLLAVAKTFTKVRLCDEFNEWLIPVQHILDNGSFLWFKDPEGFERQIFIQLSQIEEFKREVRV